MLKQKYLNKLPESIKNFVGLIVVMIIIILSFTIINIYFGQGDELVKKMKMEEERIAKEKELSKRISSLPSGYDIEYKVNALTNVSTDTQHRMTTFAMTTEDW